MKRGKYKTEKTTLVMDKQLERIKGGGCTDVLPSFRKEESPESVSRVVLRIQIRVFLTGRIRIRFCLMAGSNFYTTLLKITTFYSEILFIFFQRRIRIRFFLQK